MYERMLNQTVKPDLKKWLSTAEMQQRTHSLQSLYFRNAEHHK